jgi:ribose/xylose/arabinose/galactoside ABC-type transport system permease subunit
MYFNIYYVYLGSLGAIIMEPEMFPFIQVLGIMLIILGVLLFIAPLLLEKVPSLESIPWIILYVYRRNGFVFVTSPLLIIISILSLLWWILTRSRPP